MSSSPPLSPVSTPIPLSQKLQTEILASGPIPFARFMEIALYDKDAGYYASGNAQIGGKGGDFLTSVSFRPALGKVLAAQFVEIWQRAGSPRSITLVEHGAHSGHLMSDVLEEIKNSFPDFFPCLSPTICEPFPPLRLRQAESLQDFPVQWVDALPSQPWPFAIHFGNELLDALPVHAVVWNGKTWKERRVGFQNGSFVWIEKSLSNPVLQARLDSWPTPPKAPFFAEVCLAMEPWIKGVADSFQTGAVLLIDYGWERDAFFADHRSEGTLRAYQNHTLQKNVLVSPGKCDLTAHVDFTALRKDAQKAGLQPSGISDQNHFMVGAGRTLLLRTESESPTEARQKFLRSFAHLIHPETFGRAFKVALFTRDLPHTPPFSGFSKGF